MGQLELRSYQAAAIQALRVCLASETWKWCVGYEGAYEVSDHGNVRSVDRLGSTGRRLRGKVLTPSVIGSGYLFVNLCDGARNSEYVHRIVAKAFLENPKSCACVNHINGDKKDNRVENIEWVTHSENMRHATHILNTPKGSRFPSVPVVGVNVETGEVLRFASQSLAEIHGFDQRQISDCLHGRQKTHRGFRWESA